MEAISSKTPKVAATAGPPSVVSGPISIGYLWLAQVGAHQLPLAQVRVANDEILWRIHGYPSEGDLHTGRDLGGPITALCRHIHKERSALKCDSSNTVFPAKVASEKSVFPAKAAREKSVFPLNLAPLKRASPSPCGILDECGSLEVGFRLEGGVAEVGFPAERGTAEVSFPSKRYFVENGSAIEFALAEIGLLFLWNVALGWERVDVHSPMGICGQGCLRVSGLKIAFPLN